MHLETIEYSEVRRRGIEPARMTKLKAGRTGSGAIIWLYYRSAGYQLGGSMARIHTEEFGWQGRSHDGSSFGQVYRTLEEAAAAFDARIIESVPVPD